MMQLRAWTISALFAGLAAASGCGSSSPTITPTTITPNSATITIVGQNGTQAFTPNPASFGGQQVVFKNNDAAMHRVSLNDGSVDTGDIAPGATSRAVTMPSGGANYHCSIHPGMIGSTSASTGAPPPPCEGQYCSAY
jgi:plastocyanin